MSQPFHHQTSSDDTPPAQDWQEIQCFTHPEKSSAMRSKPLWVATAQGSWPSWFMTHRASSLPGLVSRNRAVSWRPNRPARWSKVSRQSGSESPSGHHTAMVQQSMQAQTIVSTLLAGLSQLRVTSLCFGFPSYKCLDPSEKLFISNMKFGMPCLSN